MAARATSSGTISFGLVSIPIKIYTATSSQKVRFNMLEAATGARLKQQYVSSVSGDVVERDHMVKGYEHARGQYITFDDEELKALEGTRSGSIGIVEFVPLDTIDFVQIEKSYYVGPDRGGDKAYQLLAESMMNKRVVAVGRWEARGKEQLVLIRPYNDGLIVHQLYYDNEVRAFDDIDRGADMSFADVERELAEKLIEQLSVERFQPEKFSDSYTDRVRALVEQKIAGQEITISPEAPKAQIIDLFEALKQSLAEGDDQPAAARGDASAEEPRPVKKAKARRPRKKKVSSAG